MAHKFRFTLALLPASQVERKARHVSKVQTTIHCTREGGLGQIFGGLVFFCALVGGGGVGCW